MGTHDTRTAPELAGALDLDGTEMAAMVENAPGGSVRGFRAQGAGWSAPTDVPAVDDAKGARADSHAGTGSPDDRRGATTVLAEQSHYPMHVEYQNQRRAVVVTPEDPPARPRGGSTGADATRAAQYLRPILMRPFDKGIAEHPGQVLKVEQAGPLASRSKDLGDIAGGQPFAGGSTGTQRAGVGPGRNSFRIMPKAWDALLVDTGGPAVTPENPDPAYSAAARQAGRSFRA